VTDSIPYAGRSPVESWAPRRILCATDFSENAAAALDAAVALARAARAKIVLVHVAALPLRPGVAVAGPKDGAGQVRSDPVDDLERLRGSAAAAGVEAEPVLRQGDAVGEIVCAARQAAADLIVMGRHSRGAPDHWFVGSVAEGVVRSAPCPVMVVKPFPRRRGQVPRQVLCALDLGETAPATMAQAAALTSALQADLLVLHVAGGPSSRPPTPGGADAATRDAVHHVGESLAALIAGARVPSGRARQRVVTGTPHDEILGAGHEAGSDLVVVGSHGGSIVERPFIGSTTLHLIRKADCDVLVVPARLSESEGRNRARSPENPATPEPRSLGRA
jgi:nucleotide-binding universal stress UspA family protein